MLFQSEDRGALRGLEAPDSLENSCAVVKSMRQKRYLRITPLDQFAIHPDPVRLLHCPLPRRPFVLRVKI